MARGRSKIVLGLFVFLLGMTGWGLMAQNVTVKGTVLDVNDKSKLEGVTVSVGTEAGGLTLEDGMFSFSVKRAPELKVRFQYSGSDTTLTVVTDPGVNEYAIEMLLGQKKTMTMDVVVITAGKHEQTLADVVTSMDVIGQKSVDLQISSDIEDALVQSSGVDIIDGQPNIRGSSGYAYGVGSRVMVMLDGLPLLSPDAGYVQFDLIPTDNIAQIEVMKGASSVLYGSSAMGGVINVIMADAPEEPKTSIRLRGAMYDSPYDKRLDWDSTKSAKNAGINIFHSRKIGRHDLVLLGDFWRNTGWRHGTGSTEGRAQIMTKFRPKAVPGMVWGINASTKFDSSTTFLFWDSYIPADTFYAFASDEPRYNSLGAYSGQNSARSQFNTRFTVDPYIKYLTPKGNIHNYRGRYMRTNNNNDTGQGSHNTMWYNDYQFSTHLWENRINWVSGATASFNFSDGDSLYGGDHKAVNLAVYTQFDARLTEKLNATIGGRFDNWQIDDSVNNRSPIFRAGLNYEFVKGSNIRTSFGQAFRSPSIAERYTNTFASGLTIAPNPDLLVEKGFSAEIGYRQGFLWQSKTRSDRSLLGYVDVAGFVMNYQNMIEFGVQTPDTFILTELVPVFTAKNFAHARTAGVEATAMLQYTMGKLRFDLNGGITYINPVNLDPSPDSLQVDLLNLMGPQDNPTNNEAFGMLLSMLTTEDMPGHRVDNPKVLKYRSKWLNRVSATVGYGAFNLTCNYRYKSAVLAIDQFLYAAIPGASDWVKAHPKGYGLVDIIASAQVTKGFQIALSAENAFNREYVILPGIIGEQRNFNIQMKYVF
ncbi:MAG: TonB-dependent receptor [Bacteroidetes bacterium]|nr:TonB-dependent receptor [Bacteroidota bacterium]